MYEFCILVPASGCNAISNEGHCFTSFTSTGINWKDARLECVSRGYDIATVTSSEENTLMYNTATDPGICWIGLNDIVTEGRYVWADGSDSHYTHWYSGQPDNYQRSEDCVNTWNSLSWSDASCTTTRTCFFCSSNGEYLNHVISNVIIIIFKCLIEQTYYLCKYKYF